MAAQSAKNTAPCLERVFIGLSSIILDGRRIDPGLKVAGCGSVADFLPSGKFRNRRWFEADNPL